MNSLKLHPDLNASVNLGKNVEKQATKYVFIILALGLGTGMMKEYPAWLGGLDLAMFISWLTYKYLIKNLISSKTIPAYYRQRYENITLWFNMFIPIYVGGIKRFIITTCFYVWMYYKSATIENPFAVEFVVPKERYLEGYLRFFYSPYLWVGLLIGLLTLIIMFYSGKYISVFNFSNGINVLEQDVEHKKVSLSKSKATSNSQAYSVKNLFTKSDEDVVASNLSEKTMHIGNENSSSKEVGNKIDNNDNSKHSVFVTRKPRN